MHSIIVRTECCCRLAFITHPFKNSRTAIDLLCWQGHQSEWMEFKSQSVLINGLGIDCRISSAYVHDDECQNRCRSRPIDPWRLLQHSIRSIQFYPQCHDPTLSPYFSISLRFKSLSISNLSGFNDSIHTSRRQIIPKTLKEKQFPSSPSEMGDSYSEQLQIPPLVEISSNQICQSLACFKKIPTYTLIPH